MAVDILYLARNRREFTLETMGALLANTEWSLVRRLVIYDDASTDGTAEVLRAVQAPVETVFRAVDLRSPVAIMNAFLTQESPAAVFAKIDNDTLVPRRWLTECLRVLDQTPWLDLLGIEAMRPAAPAAARRFVEDAAYIGGIGLMRTRAFAHSLPRPDGRFGFTAWQDHEAALRKGWLKPALPVCLLDRVPFDPWRSLSAEYVAKGWQRPWEPYGPEQSSLWEWWQR